MKQLYVSVGNNILDIRDAFRTKDILLLIMFLQIRDALRAKKILTSDGLTLYAAVQDDVIENVSVNVVGLTFCFYSMFYWYDHHAWVWCEQTSDAGVDYELIFKFKKELSSQAGEFSMKLSVHSMLNQILSFLTQKRHRKL